MTKPICSFPTCERRVHANGWCATHDGQVRRGLEPYAFAARPTKSAEDRFSTKYVPSPDGCWNWTGHQTERGYGRFSVGHGTSDYAHRWSYEHHVGPIPDGLVIDHLCRNHSCVNPAHLEAVTQAVNVQRGDSAGLSAVCRRGHERSPENTYVWTGIVYGAMRTVRTCKSCRKLLAA